MRLYALMLFLHVIGSVIWVGGMFLMHFAVRPSAAQLLEPPQRLPLLAAILGRFFAWVAASVLVVLASGLAMIFGAGGVAVMHASVHLMFVVGVAMMAIYGYLRFVPFVRLRAAVQDKDWPRAARSMDRIRALVGVNLILGVLTIGIATLGRAML
jgi:uncharacterized membrane protein